MNFDLSLQISLVALALSIFPLPDVISRWICFFFPGIRSPATRLHDLRKHIKNKQRLLDGLAHAVSDDMLTRWTTTKDMALKLEARIDSHQSRWTKLPLAHWLFWTKREREIRHDLRKLTARIEHFCRTDLPSLRVASTTPVLAETPSPAQVPGAPSPAQELKGEVVGSITHSAAGTRPAVPTGAPRLSSPGAQPASPVGSNPFASDTASLDERPRSPPPEPAAATPDSHPEPRRRRSTQFLRSRPSVASLSTIRTPNPRARKLTLPTPAGNATESDSPNTNANCSHPKGSSSETDASRSASCDTPLKPPADSTSVCQHQKYMSGGRTSQPARRTQAVSIPRKDTDLSESNYAASPFRNAVAQADTRGQTGAPSGDVPKPLTRKTRTNSRRLSGRRASLRS